MPLGKKRRRKRPRKRKFLGSQFTECCSNAKRKCVGSSHGSTEVCSTSSVRVCVCVWVGGGVQVPRPPPEVAVLRIL